jgi:glycine cleavage system H protein
MKMEERVAPGCHTKMEMKIIEGLKYSKDHEWVKVDGKNATVGITDHAQGQLGDIVFVELPAVGSQLAAGDVLGVVESVKAASDIYTPIAGEVVAANDQIAASPEKLNEDPYGSWIAVLQISDPSQLDELLDATAYQSFCEA